MIPNGGLAKGLGRLQNMGLLNQVRQTLSRNLIRPKGPKQLNAAFQKLLYLETQLRF